MSESKILRGLQQMVEAAKCEHDFEYLRATGPAGQIGRCRRCRCRFTAWPGTAHYDEIVAAKALRETT